MAAKFKTPGSGRSLVHGDGNKLLICDRATVIPGQGIDTSSDNSAAKLRMNI